MRNEEDVNQWLKKADEDFLFASSTLPDSTFYAQICFHFQQAAEKYLKAYIISNKLEFKKIHDLVQLLNICSRKDSKFSELFEEANLLTDYYIDTRYPVHWPSETTKEDAENAKEATARIKNIVESLIKI